MTDTPDRELLKRLAEAAGPPGEESEVRSIVRTALEGLGEIRYDALGSILCERRGKSERPRVVLDCHLDEVGFMVQSITGEGRLKITALGGWWGHVLLAQRVLILTGKGKIPGVISSKPPHFLGPEERKAVIDVEQMHVDVGAESREEVEAFGIRVGDTIVPDSQFRPMANPEILSCKAFDNRAGVGVMCEAMKLLARAGHPNTVIAVGAVQEEVGCRGAATASELSNPDVAFVLEGTPADYVSGVAEKQAILGKGPQIRFYDPTAISNRRLVRFVQETAAEMRMEVQLAVRTSGGTNARSIQVHGSGVPTVVIGVPARYIHTHVTLIHWRDYQNAIKLVVKLVERCVEARVREFTQYE